MTNMRVENNHFIYREDYYPGNEYLLHAAGSDERGRTTFVAVRIFDGKLPYLYEDWKEIPNAIAPKGYKWYSNGKSRFDKRYETALMRVKGD